jgi:hypothetical protein
MGETGFRWLKVGSSDGFCEHSNVLPGSMKRAGYFLTR